MLNKVHGASHRPDQNFMLLFSKTISAKSIRTVLLQFLKSSFAVFWVCFIFFSTRGKKLALIFFLYSGLTTQSWCWPRGICSILPLEDIAFLHWKKAERERYWFSASRKSVNPLLCLLWCSLLSHSYYFYCCFYYFTDIIGNHQASTVRDAELNQIYPQLKVS